MATPHYSPQPEVTRIEDPVTYEEACALFARTGHKVGVTTLRRYVKEDGLATRRTGIKGTVELSWSDLLDAHYKRTAARLRASSNWP